MSVINTIGRRKTSVARLYMQPGAGNITINGKVLDQYFPSEIKRIIVNQPLVLTEKIGNFDISINVDGGGITGQAEAIRLALSRALVENASENKPVLKKEGFMTRDSRMVERKKPGRKKARRRFQWVKR
ncbi:MAG: 30S ribosomal protein S9 [Cytophagales bacterium]|nr:MAG: 30S ribosomal protein S9 [Cytophagales bacterium]